ncbi:MAG: hypothetical protein LT106_18705 [Burkholderiaceae bacterium]|nr:hypothetical protein [Burkholderiaceae bacterium]
MKPIERYAWIEREMDVRNFGEASTLDRDFVDRYVEETGAKAQLRTVGADYCPQLGRDLRAMWRRGRLTRSATGIDGGLCGMGFPRWCWVYRLRRGALAIDAGRVAA